MRYNFYAAAVTGMLLLTGCSDTADVVNINSTADTTSPVTQQTTVQSNELTDIQMSNLTEFFNSIDIIDENTLNESIRAFTDVALLETEKTIAYGESLTKSLVDKVKASDEYRILYADGDVKMETAVKGEKMKLAVCIDKTASSMFFENSTVYSYYPIEKSGYKFTLSKEDMQSYTSENLLNSMLYYPETDEENVNISSISVADESFTCELFDGYAYIFRQDGSMAMFCDNSNSFTAKVETENISDDIFAIPADYATTDYDEFLQQLETAS